ncbi:IclR family transcriptional regulator [Proteiniclasticum ruminis]|uniref:IclR family transcriptional regulator n=1 Tax=Proteiniclasticum ruminis TaxID=398199 RepID=UPI0028B05BBB|nr:IclR family transcriptional regulator [Proteiniclasticum ruminis]
MADTVQSIDRALSLLEILSSSKEGMGLLELGEASGLSKGTVHRLLYTLTENGYVKQLEKTGKYQLTMKMFVLGAKPVEKMDVLRVARPYLEKLRDLSEEVVHLVLPDGHEILYVDKVETENTIRMYSNIGKRGTLYATSVGKAMLSYYSEEEVQKLWPQMGVHKLTEYTITELPDFLEELETIRENGFALDREENELGVQCMGAAILDYTNTPVAAFSISGPVQRMTEEKINTLKEAMLETKRKISEDLGYYKKR